MSIFFNNIKNKIIHIDFMIFYLYLFTTYNVKLGF